MSSPDPSKLALYSTQWFPFCVRVRRAIEALDLQVEVRDINKSNDHYQDLINARGRGTVPVLRIEEDGADTWMPESQDIIAFLEKTYGHAAKST